MWLNRQAEGGSNRDDMQDFEHRLAGVDERCLGIVTKAFQVPFFAARSPSGVVLVPFTE